MIMRKIIFSLVLVGFFNAVNAQSDDVKTVSGIVEKVHNRLKNVKAVEFLAKESELESGKNTRLIREIKGFFKVVPDDKAAGCKYFVQWGDDNMMYDGNNRYDSSLYGGHLQVADTKKYPDQAKLEFMSPNPFQNLLDMFENEYGKTAAIAKRNCVENGMKVKLSVEKKDSKIYNVLSCGFPSNDKKAAVVIYLTKDYLPEKVITNYSNSSGMSYVIEKYTLLKNMPDTKFSVSLMGKYNWISRYQGEGNGYVEDKE